MGVVAINGGTGCGGVEGDKEFGFELVVSEMSGGQCGNASRKLRRKAAGGNRNLEEMGWKPVSIDEIISGVSADRDCVGPQDTPAFCQQMPGTLGFPLSAPRREPPPHNICPAPSPASWKRLPGSCAPGLAPSSAQACWQLGSAHLPSSLTPGEAKASGNVAEGLRARALASDLGL